MTKYAAFLRGINVGGHKVIKMEALKKAFESFGFQNVKTLLASGNVLFETAESDSNALTQKIEQNLKKTFGFEVGTLLRTKQKMHALADSEPFKKMKVTPHTRLYVTFLKERSKSGLKIPYESPEKDFRIVSVSAGEVCSVVTLSPKRQTTDLMVFLEKEFGRNITTRNWNTITRLLKKIKTVSDVH